MKVLLEMNQRIIEKIGFQKPFALSQRPMKYCVKIDNGNGIVIYNCITLEMIAFDYSEDVNSYLFKHWFTVPDSFCEKEWFNQIRQEIKLEDSQKSLHRFTIFTTTECNARCFYCYERGIPQISMTPKVATDTADFIAGQYQGEPHKLHWFGGEPLCNTEAIDIITKKLSDKKVPYSSVMTSNGYMFHESMVKRAASLWKLESVQITLDGTEQQYNRIKNYINCGQNAFEKVLCNITELLQNQIAVKIRLNVGLYNIEDMFNLIDILSSRFACSRFISVYPALVDKYQYKYSSEEIIERNKQFQNVQKHLEESGMQYKRKSIDNVLRITNCVGDDYRGCVILPDGKLSKCATLMDEEVYGDIYMNPAEYNSDVIESWQRRGTEIQQCDDCCIYPLCSKRLYKCPSDRKNPIYDYECKTRIFDYVSTISSCGKQNI